MITLLSMNMRGEKDVHNIVHHNYCTV